MREARELLLAILISIAGFALVFPAASAQDAPAPDTYQFSVTPYLWLASVHAMTQTPFALAPEVNSSVSAVQALSKSAYTRQSKVRTSFSGRCSTTISGKTNVTAALITSTRA